MNTPEAMVSVYWDIVTRYPQVWVVEIFAGLFLAWFAYRYRLYWWPVLKYFIFTGHILPNAVHGFQTEFRISFSSGFDLLKQMVKPAPQQADE